MENVCVRRKKYKKLLHEILTPKEETKCRIFVNRDVNACKNILLLGKCYLESQTRPEQFTRKAIVKEKVKKSRKQSIKNKQLFH
jgi:uracil-DNA glycosylase